MELLLGGKDSKASGVPIYQVGCKIIAVSTSIGNVINAVRYLVKSSAVKSISRVIQETGRRKIDSKSIVDNSSGARDRSISKSNVCSSSEDRVEGIPESRIDSAIDGRMGVVTK